jgi:hypothetical protein
MSLRAALQLALQDGARAAMRGVQRTASGALDRAEGALAGGAQVGGMLGLPVGLYPYAIAGGVSALSDYDLTEGEHEGFRNFAGATVGGAAALGALSGMAAGRSSFLRMGAKESVKAFQKYIRHLRRIGLREEAARAEAAWAIGKGDSFNAARTLERMERAPHHADVRRRIARAERLGEEETRLIAEAMLRQMRNRGGRQ